MKSADIVTMLGNLSQSLMPVQHLITGAAYMVGILFFWSAIQKLKNIGDARARSGSHEKMFVPLAYIVAGAALIFLPSTLSVMSNTAFGTGNILQYTSFNKVDVYSSVGLVVRTAGLIWFFRGAVLLAHASEPGVQEGPKGLVFLITGVMAINFDNTIAMLNTVLQDLINVTMAIKQNRGY